jgi:hypothetical protein
MENIVSKWSQKNDIRINVEFIANLISFCSPWSFVVKVQSYITQKRRVSYSFKFCNNHLNNYHEGVGSMCNIKLCGW